MLKKTNSRPNRRLHLIPFSSRRRRCRSRSRRRRRRRSRSRRTPQAGDYPNTLPSSSSLGGWIFPPAAAPEGNLGLAERGIDGGARVVGGARRSTSRAPRFRIPSRCGAAAREDQVSPSVPALVLLPAKGKDMKPSAQFTYLSFKVDGLTSVLFYHAGTKEMPPKKKKTGAKKKAVINKPPRICHYLLLPGENGTPVIDFVKSLLPGKKTGAKRETDIMCDQEPVGQTQRWLNPPASFTESVKQILFRITNMPLDVISSGHCFESLRPENIIVTDYFEIPKLLVANLKERTAEGTKANLTALGNLLDQLVSETSEKYYTDSSINPEFKHLIQHIKGYQQGDPFFLMRYPICYVPLENRSFLYAEMYDYIMDILRETDPEAFQFVITSLSYPLDWNAQCQSNTYLLQSLGRSRYDPDATRFPAESDPRLEVLRYHRNGPAHPLEDAADPSKENGMSSTRADLAHRLYFLFPRLMSSMQTSLHFLGALRHLGTEKLFPFQVGKPDGTQ
ncbi:hypothetical protein ZWY2020_039828 [Hordeum vulgare]|nr:hypothetical protein ZWY2020_039828 [Hordeum vulgare]